MDFFTIGVKEGKGPPEIYPDFVVGRTKDLMIRGKSFYAIWDEEQNLWSCDEYDVQRLVDAALRKKAEELQAQTGVPHQIRSLRLFGSSSWSQFRKYVQNLSDNSKPLDENLTFANTQVRKQDYASKRLPYPLEAGDHSAWDELLSVLYAPEEREKIEWAIGSIVCGDSKKIQKFLVFYGPGGTGKSTILNIILDLFQGYTTTFEAKALGSNNGAFATEVFKDNPLVAIQQDGDLSRIEDNTRLNSIISHEEMTMNEKYKPSYTSRVNAFLFMGTNQPVKISDAKSGIIRRLIDVNPTGNRIPPNHYNTLMSRIEFERGAIAHHCLQVYRELGKNYYNSYRPLEMMLQTDIFFNFIEAHYDIFKSQGGVSLKQAYSLYKEYCSETGIEKPLPQYRVRSELKNYFDEFKERHDIDGVVVRSYYSGFNANKFKVPTKNEKVFSLVLDSTVSLLDDVLRDMPAQLASEHGTPRRPWDKVDETLQDIPTEQLHYVRLTPNHIVIDFDLTDDSGNKSLEANLRAASSWPPTYAELSKGGAGVHLHYIYEGDPSELAHEWKPGIEIKTFSGGASLRRRLSKCNQVPIGTINSGLPLKEKTVIPVTTMQSERGLRELIYRNLRKEIHPGTKPSVDFIHKVLDDAYNSGLIYNVEDLRPRVIAFANNSSNQALQCLKTVQKMKFVGAELPAVDFTPQTTDDRLAFFDVEVYPNLFVVCWKFEGSDQVVRMINPSPAEIEQLMKLRLVGFYNRRYDNHILYARFMGYDNEALYALSRKMIVDNVGFFGEAYNLSYADIYEFSSTKQSLKKFQIDLGLPHVEMDIPWDQSVPDEKVLQVVDYCVNDVETTESVFVSRKQDYVARQILAELSGLSVNDTTARHTSRIIFGTDRNPQTSFVYTDLGDMFPGYEYNMGKSTYRDELVGEGGYVYAEPGMYENVALLDVASMHPTSIELLNLFGDYTPNFSALKAARLAIKHRDYDSAEVMLGGKLKPFLQDRGNSDALSHALKIVINIVYGLTSAKFVNPFRDVRNKDNIVAKRGALFMIDLKHAVQEQGFTVAHIKTDSIKIPNATPEIIDFVMRFGEKYGYDFEHETTYEKMALVNDAVYVAKSEKGWSATGAQFQQPYVFKTLFTNEPLEFEDFCLTKQVSKGAMYIDFDAVQRPMVDYSGMQFVGRTGKFVPVTEESGGGILYRVDGDDKHLVGGTKGHFWMEAHIALAQQAEVDINYFEGMAIEARRALEQFGDVDRFIS